MTEPNSLWFYFPFLMIVGVILIYAGFKRLGQKRIIENIPTSKIRSIAMGTIEIKGKAKNASFLQTAPLSKKRCVYYKVKIMEYKKQGKNSHWVVVHQNVHSSPFIVQDETGKILLDMTDATIDIKETFNEESRWGKDPSKNVMQYLKSNNIDFEGFFGMNKTMKYVEQAILLDEEIYVMGEAMHSEEGKVKIGKKGRFGFYYVSNKSENELIKKFNREAIIATLMGVGCFIFAIWLYIKVR